MCCRGDVFMWAPDSPHEGNQSWAEHPQTFGRDPMKTLLRAAIVAVGLIAGLSQVYAQSAAYQAPAHNYYQNKWMNG